MGKNVVDSAINAGVSYMIHASLPSASKLTNGKVPMVSFDGKCLANFTPNADQSKIFREGYNVLTNCKTDKARTSEYIFECATSSRLKSATVVNAGWFLENAFDDKYVRSFGGFAKIVDKDGYLTWRTPYMGNDPESTPWLAVADDYGDIVHGVLMDPQRWDGECIDAVSESMSFEQMTATFERGEWPTISHHSCESLWNSSCLQDY